MNEKLIAALLAFADKRGHWPGCPQSRRSFRYSKIDEHGDEVLRPCSPKCRRARQAIEAAGGSVDQEDRKPGVATSAKRRPVWPGEQ